MKHGIILVGFMGCGKSTIGKLLAEKLELPLLDTDRVIEERQNKSIEAIFAEDGEAAFRESEREALIFLQSHGDAVVSTGGGMPIPSENRELLRKLGSVVWLTAEPCSIASRIPDVSSRPLLHKYKDRLLDGIRELMEERAAFYEDVCDIKVCTDGIPPEKVVENICRELGML